MDWQQYLHNITIPLADRLTGAKSAFLSISGQLSTRQKEDIVIQWLTSLIRGKLDDVTNENVDAEQCQVWGLLATIFSSQRIKHLAEHHWNCPVTSKFLLITVDILESTSCRSAIQENIISTLHSILNISSISTLITNSSQLCLSLCKVLLDIISSYDWKAVQDEVQKSIENDEKNVQDYSKFLLKRRKTEGGVANKTEEEQLINSNVNINCENLLNTLCFLLKDAQLQMEAASKKNNIAIHFYQMLRKIIGAKIALRPYNGEMKDKVVKQLDSVVATSFFSSIVMTKYETFLREIMIEDCKSNFRDHNIRVCLNILSDIMANDDSLDIMKLTLFGFFNNFSKKCASLELQQNMLIMLLHIGGIQVPGFTLFADTPAFTVINVGGIDAKRSEIISSVLVSVIKGEKSNLFREHGEKYLMALLEHMCQKTPSTVDGFFAIRKIISMFPLKFGDQLPKLIGTLAVWKKEDEEIQFSYNDILCDILLPHTKLLRVESFVISLMKGIIECKEDLQNHEQFMQPMFGEGSDVNVCNYLLLPNKFVLELQKSVAVIEPLQYCQVLESVLDFWKTEVLPLVWYTDSEMVPSNCRAIAAIALVTSKIMCRSLPRRTCQVYGVCAKLSNTLAKYFSDVVKPLLDSVLNNKHDNSILIGVFVLWRSLLHLLRSLSTKLEFLSEWSKVSATLQTPDDVSKVIPLMAYSTLSQIEARLDNFGDTYSKMQCLLFCMQVLTYVTVQDNYDNTTPYENLLVANQINNKQNKNINKTSTTNTTQMTTLVLKLLDRWRSPLNFDHNVIPTSKLFNLMPPGLNIGSYFARCIVEDCMNSSTLKVPINSTSYELVKSHFPEIITEILINLISSIEFKKMEKKRSKRKSMDAGITNENTESSFCSFLNDVNKCLKGPTTKAPKKKGFFKESSKSIGVKFGEIISNMDDKLPKYTNEFINNEKCTKLLNILNTLPLEYFDDESITLVLYVVLMICFHCNLSGTDPVVATIFRIANSCFKSNKRLRFTSTVDLSVLVRRLVIILPNLKSIEFNESEKKLTTDLHVEKLFQLIMDNFLTTSTDIDTSLLDCATHLISYAKHDTTSQNEEVFLRSAWIFVHGCHNYIFNVGNKTSGAETRKKWCDKVIRNIGSWCLKLVHKIDKDNYKDRDALYILRIYTILITVEIRREESKNSDKNTSVGDVNQSVVSDAGVKIPKWRKYLADGIELARMCLTSDSPILVNTTLSFVIAFQALPDNFQENLPSDINLESLKAFTKKPAVNGSYIAIKRDDTDTDLATISQVMEDPITNKPISFKSLLSNAPFYVYKDILGDLVKRSCDLEEGTFAHTASIWVSIINTNVSQNHNRVKKSALSVLTRSIVWYLTRPERSGIIDHDFYVGYKGSLMISMMELLSSIICISGKLPPHTVSQCISVANVSTRHLNLEHFVKVWQQQIILLEHCILRRERTFKTRLGGLMGALMFLVDQLVERSSKKANTRRSKEILTGCTLYLERLVHNLHHLNPGLSKFAHFSVSRMICALHETNVIPPVKSVLDQLIYQMFKLCDDNALSHLPVAVPTKVRQLLRFYQDNYISHYTYDAKKDFKKSGNNTKVSMH